MMRKILCVCILVLLLVAALGAIAPGGAPAAVSRGDEGYSTKATESVKPMVFYLHNDTTSHLIFDYSTTYIFDTNLGNRLQSIGDLQRVRLNFYLFPQLAGNLTVKGNITVGIYANTTGISANGNLYAALYDVEYKSGSTTVETLVGEGGPVSYTITAAIDYYEVTIPDVYYNFSANHSMRLYIEIQGGAESYFMIWYGDESYDARVKMDSLDYMEIDVVKTKNANGTYTSFFEPDALNKTVIVETTVLDPFGGYDIEYVNVTIIDPDGNVVVNNESMSKVSGTPKSFESIYEYSWNYSGYPVGTYTVHVWALDNNGYYYYWHFEQYNYGPYDDTYDTYFLIGYKSKVHVWVYDAVGTVLDGVTVELVDQYGNAVSNITNESGYSMLLAYNGTYDLVVLWNGNRVTWSGTHMVVNGGNVTGSIFNVSGETTVEVYTDLGNLNFFVKDTHGVPLESAMVFLVYPNGTHTPSMLTDSNGMLSVGYSPGGEYSLSIYWKNVEVYSGSVELHFPKDVGERTIEITAAVYYLTVRVLDNQDRGMPDLHVVIYNSVTQLVEEVGITNATGYTTLRLPVGYKDIKIYLREQIVYETADYAITADDTLVVHAWVYDVTFRVKDSHNLPVENADIYVYKGGDLITSGTTDENGVATLTLIKGEYTVKIYWRGTKVHEMVIMVEDNVTYDVSAAVYYLTLNVLDNHGNGIPDLQVVIYNNATRYVEEIAKTDPNGTVTVRLPASDKDIVIYSGDQVIFRKDGYPFYSDSTLTIYAWIYDVTFVVKDSQGLPVEDSYVYVYRNGDVVANGITDENGEVVLTLVKGDYSYVVLWKGVQVYEAELLVEDNATVEISADIYYLEFHVLDNHGVGIYNLQVVVYNHNTQLIEEIGITNYTGHVTLRLPAGLKDIKIYSGDQIVYERDSYDFSDDVTLTIYAWLYDITFKVLDSRNVGVEGATVYIYRGNELVDSVVTGSDGTATVTLIKGEYTLRTYWMNVLVYSSNISAVDNATVEMKSSIYYLTVKLVGNDGKPIEGTIVISAGERTLYTTTGSKAEVRLPEGEYVVHTSISKEMYLTGVEESISRDITLSGDQEITVQFEKYPVSFAGSNLSYVLFGYLILIAVLALAVTKLRRKPPAESEIVYPEEGPEEETPVEEEL